MSKKLHKNDKFVSTQHFSCVIYTHLFSCAPTSCYFLLHRELLKHEKSPLWLSLSFCVNIFVSIDRFQFTSLLVAPDYTSRNNNVWISLMLCSHFCTNKQTHFKWALDVQYLKPENIFVGLLCYLLLLILLDVVNTACFTINSFSLSFV